MMPDRRLSDHSSSTGIGSTILRALALVPEERPLVCTIYALRSLPTGFLYEDGIGHGATNSNGSPRAIRARTAPACFHSL